MVECIYFSLDFKNEVFFVIIFVSGIIFIRPAFVIKIILIIVKHWRKLFIIIKMKKAFKTTSVRTLIHIYFFFFFQMHLI